MPPLDSLAFETSRTPAPCADAPDDSWSTGRLINHIRQRYHRVHESELADAIALAHKVEAVHSTAPLCPHGLADVLEALLEHLEVHHQKEEGVLFPAMLRGGGRAVAKVVRHMDVEHDDTIGLLDRMRAAAHGYAAPAHACTTWGLLYTLCRKLDSDLREHMRLENSVLFRRFAEPSAGGDLR